MGKSPSVKKVLPQLAKIFHYFGPYIRKHDMLVSGSLIALLAEVAFRLLEPWPLKFIFDYIIVASPERPQSGLPFLPSMTTTTLLSLSVVAIVVFAGLRATCSYSKIVGFALIGNRVLTEVRNDFFRHLQTLSLRYHNKARSGDLVIRIIGDIGMMKEATVTAFLPFLGNVLILLGMIAVMFFINLKLALISLVIFPLFYLATTRISRRVRDVVQKQRKREGAMAATASESLGAMKTVQALSLEENFASAFTNQSKKDMKEGVKVKKLTAGLERTADVMIALGTALVVWYGSLLVVRKELTPGDLIVFLAYLKNAFRPLRNFAKYIGRISKATAAGERVISILEETPEIQNLPHAVPAPNFQGSVEFSRIQFGYEKGHPILTQFDFKAKAGESIAIVGPSGIGKSTLAGLILRLYDPEQGKVLIDGRDIRDFKVRSLRSQISVVLQDNLLFTGTIKENIAALVPEATQEKIEDAARLANAHEFILLQPQGYETMVGERGTTLSHGQRQRIAIARATLLDSPILLLDEPTTGLDGENEKAVIESLLKLAQGRTTFLITHNLTLAAKTDQILYIHNGRVAEKGTHQELLQKKNRYASLFQTQMNSFFIPKGDLHAVAS